MDEETEFEKRLFIVARRLNVTTNDIVEYLQNNGYGEALTGSNFNASIIEKEAYQVLKNEFASDGGSGEASQDNETTGQNNEESSGLSPDQCVCGSSSVEVTGENGNVRTCRGCGISWYLNHCWNCESTIDSRSDAVVECGGCGWYKCGHCGECREDCEYTPEESDTSATDTKQEENEAFEKTLFELAEELDVSTGQITTYLEDHGYASALEGAGLGITLTSEAAYQVLKAEYPNNESGSFSRGGRSKDADSSWKMTSGGGEDFERRLSEIAKELDLSTNLVFQLLREKGYEDAISGSGFQATLTRRDAYHALKAKYSGDTSGSSSQDTRDTRADSSTAEGRDTSEQGGTGLADDQFSKDRTRMTGGSESGEDGTAFIHIQLTTTGADQLLQVVGSGGQMPEEGYRKRRQAGSRLQTYSSERTATYISRMQDTDRDSNESMVSLRLEREDESIELVLTPKDKCFLLLGARRRDSRKRVYEEEIELKLFIDSDGRPPISKGLWDKVKTLDTKEDRAEEVERRLRQWTAYLRVQEKEAERRQFHLLYDSVRHLEKPGRIRLHLSQREQDNDHHRLQQARRDRVSIYETASADGRSVARAVVVHYDEQEHCLVLDLMDEDAERLQKERLTIPPTGSVEHQARGALSMIHRQQDGIERLKQTGGAMEKLDRFLFGSDEEINPPPFGPVNPIPTSECLDPEHTNEKQRLAVANALECPDMFFLQGPPGTGKTTFIAELCYQLGRRDKRALVASQANLAVDNALGRLQKSRDILAVREAQEKKVEEEGKPFIGENAVRTWLKGVAHHSRSRIQDRQGKLEAWETAKHHRELLDDWIRDGANTESEIDRLQEKVDGYADEISALREQRAEKQEWAATLNAVTEFLNPEELLGDESALKLTGDRHEKRAVWDEVEPSIRRTWRRASKQARQLVDGEVEDPWETCEALNRLHKELGPKGKYPKMVEGAERATEDHQPLFERVRRAKEQLHEAEENLRQAKQQKKRQIEALKEVEKIDGEHRSLNPEDIHKEYFPTWFGSAKRVSKARALLVGRRSQEGDTPQQPASELARRWRDAETANRSKDAEHLLRQLHVAVTNQRKLTRWWGIGWLFNMWLSVILDDVEQAIEKVEDCIQGHSSSLAERIEQEIESCRTESQRAIEQLDEEIKRYRSQVEDSQKNLDSLRDEIAVVSDQLRSRFEGLLSKEDVKGESKIERFMSIMEALRDAASRLENDRRRVSKQREKVQDGLRQVRDELTAKAQKTREEAEEYLERIDRRKQAVDSHEKKIEELRRRHSHARNVWRKICEKDPNLSGDPIEDRPSTEWLDRYIEEHQRDWTQFEAEKNLVDDWSEAIAEGDQKISEALKTRFFRNANVVGATCARTGKDDFQNQYGIFDVVIIDEVSKATPTELLMPALLGKKVVLVGDHRQLAPVFGHQSNFAAAADRLDMEEEDLQENLRRSLFKERFEYFSEQEDSREEPEGDAHAGRRTLMLTKQYRMHSQIMRGINQFYSEKLELGHLQENGEDIPLDEVRNHGLEISPWASENRHLVWVDTPVEGEWEHTQEGPTRYNEKEMETTLSMLQSLGNAFEGADRESLSVGVTSVYAAQVNRLRQKIRQLSLPDDMEGDLRISTVDRFQGMERDIMFLNLVLNRHGLPPSKWLRTPERINVAMSRARRLLVIVGSKHNYVEVDGTSPAYSRFFNVARKYGHYVRANHILDRSHMDGD